MAKVLTDAQESGAPTSETGVHLNDIQVAPVSFMWLDALVEIDATWNPTSWSERLFNVELANPASRVRGIFYRDQLIGYVIAHVVLDEAHIVSLGIRPEFRGQGMGRALLNDLLRVCQLERIQNVTLQVRVSNQAALKLYQRAGFRMVGVRKHYYSDNLEDALTMHLEVSR